MVVFLTGLEDALNEDSDSDTDFNFDKEAIITYYYNRGFEYNEILGFLEKHHNNCISYSTLLRRLKQYGLSRRSQPSEDLLKHVRERIKEIIDGPGSMGGYRTIWHTLEMEGIKVPRIVVQEIVKELGGCPVEVVTDLGTENSLLASIQSYFQENPDAHQYVPSPRNQRIEGWWSFFFQKQVSMVEKFVSGPRSPT